MTNAIVRNNELIVEGTKKKKGRERPKITLLEVLKNDMSIKGVTLSMTLNRVE